MQTLTILSKLRFNWPERVQVTMSAVSLGGLSFEMVNVEETRPEHIGCNTVLVLIPGRYFHCDNPVLFETILKKVKNIYKETVPSIETTTVFKQY